MSSFGFGGTNFHVVLEEHGAEPAAPYRLHALPSMVVLHASDRDALLARCEGLCGSLNEPEGGARLPAAPRGAKGSRARPGSPCPAGLRGRVPGLVRRFAGQRRPSSCGPTPARRVGASPGPLLPPNGAGPRRARGGPLSRSGGADGGDGAGAGPELPRRPAGLRARRRGAATPGAGRGCRRSFSPPPARDAEGEQAQRDRLTRTENAQPAIGALSASLFGLLRQAGFRPDFVAGHSFGELSASLGVGRPRRGGLLRPSRGPRAGHDCQVRRGVRRGAPCSPSWPGARR